MASIKQLNERKFKITVSNGYRSDGRKISRSKNITVPQSVQRRGIPQYVAHVAEELERQFKSGFSEDAEMRFEDYARRWLKRQTKYAPSTLASYKRLLEVTYPYIGSIPLNRLRPIALENMLAELRKRVSRGKRIQEATVQKYLTVVSVVLSDAKRNEILLRNPARMLDLPVPEKISQDIPTDIEARRFLDLIANEPYLYTAYYALAIYTGCRRGELCALKWDDFQMCGRDACVLTVGRSRSHVAGQGIIEGPTKNGKSRTIFLDAAMTSILQTLSCCQSDSDYLFCNETGSPIHPDTFTKRLRHLLDRNGFSKSFHLHTLRHYFVSSLLHSGVDKQTVAELAGHGDTSFLERTYCHPQLALKRQAAERMEETLFSQCGFNNMPLSSTG